jgi:diguanylate cyclase (GGDEF)-like protein
MTLPVSGFPGNLAARLLRCAGLLAAGVFLASAPVRAGCIDSDDPADRRLVELSERDAHKAVREGAAGLAAQLKLAHPDPARLAFFHGVQAYAYSMLELDAQARQAARQGLRVAPAGATRLNLAMILAENAYDLAGLARAIESIEELRGTVAPGTVADSCLLISHGRLEFRAGRIDLAVRDHTRAYQDSITAQRPRQRVLAAGALSVVMRAAGDFEQAEALIREVIAWDTAHDLTLDLSVQRYQLATVMQDMHHDGPALEQLARARQLSEQLGDDQGVAFVDLHVCQIRASQNDTATARRSCEQALRTFQRNETIDMVKDTRVTLAQLDLEEGLPAAALATLNGVLEHGGRDVLPRSLPRMYQLRSEVEARLGLYEAAYRDSAEFLRRYQVTNESERQRQVTALRTRFDADREIERNELLQRQLALERERAERQRLQLRWTASLAAAGAALIALLAYIVVSTQRHRRQLLRLAGEDALTGLANRRETTLLAEAALAGCVRRGQVLTLALLDLDHFKRVNDRLGHAEGDRVLREFARQARTQLRASDILGRWGGEEFLLVMADCTLDQGLATLERVRDAIRAIAMVPGPAPEPLTLSAGLATNEDAAPTLEALVVRADAALYEAKNSGRDGVRVARKSVAVGGP